MLTHKIADLVLKNRVGLRFAERLNHSLSWHLLRMQKRLSIEISPKGLVMGGPFQGMRYNGGDEILGSSILPKLVGSYEEELHTYLTDIIVSPYATVVDIGCDDGYYAVGLATLMPSTRVVAFDINPTALRRCVALARDNGVADRVTVVEGCTADQLRQAATGASCLILSDCEGAEDFLLHPSTLPASAAQCDLLIEAHDTPARPDMASTLVERFHATHDAKILVGAPRQPGKYSSLRGLNPAETDMALNEYRPFFMKWVFLRQKLSPTS